MKPFDLPTTRNPLLDRADFERSLVQLLEPLAGRYVEGDAGLHLGNAGAHFPPRTALLEGWSRVLWGIGPLIAGGGAYPALDLHLAGLRAGTDPASPFYWGVPGDSDQRLVEMASIALCLAIAPGCFWEPLSAGEQENLRAWLATIQELRLPSNNWHFFRILVCCAFRVLGLPVNETAEAESFDLIESLYRGDGWYQDGPDGGFDLYNPFGFHFYGLVYARLMADRDPARAARYLERARLFAPQFLAYLREDGDLVPYGRSLTYRFAAISFFSACAFAGLEVVPWGALKGIVLRNLRRWYARPILDAAGLLTVGYGFPNLIMAEQYNSPGSPYWACKAYLVLALGAEHPFWRAAEAPLPPQPSVARLKVPHFLISRSSEDVQLLCPGRYPPWEAVQAAAKYSKFAYSARFGFCVSHGGRGLAKTGCDSMLMLSEGDGYWRERREAFAQESGPDWTRGRWKPWDDVEIETTLCARGSWHLRVHRIKSGRRLEAAEGGFSVPRYRGHEAPTEALVRRRPGEAAVAFPWAASRIVDLPTGRDAMRRGEPVTLDPNLNILEPSGIVPVLLGILEPGESVLACAVRAGDPEATMEDLPPRAEIAADGSLRSLS